MSVPKKKTSLKNAAPKKPTDDEMKKVRRGEPGALADQSFDPFKDSSIHVNKLDDVSTIVTPDKAWWFLQHCKGNRVIKEAKLSKYAKDMSSGRFSHSDSCITFVDGNMTNGSHRCLASVISGKPFRAIIVGDMPQSAVIHMDDGAGRSLADHFRYYTNMAPGKHKRAAAATVRAVRYSQGVRNSNLIAGANSLSTSETMSFYLKNRRLIDDVISQPRPPSSSPVRTESVIDLFRAITFPIDRVRAIAFLGNFFTGENLASNNPVNVARNQCFELSAKMVGHRGGGFAQLQVLIGAWNAEALGETHRKFFPYNDTTLPKAM